MKISEQEIAEEFGVELPQPEGQEQPQETPQEPPREDGGEPENGPDTQEPEGQEPEDTETPETQDPAAPPEMSAGEWRQWAEEPTVLQFSFAPKLVLVFMQPLNSSSSGRLLLFLAGELSDLYVKEAYFVFAASAISSSGTFAKMEHGALSFYSTGSAENQGNRLRQEYRYIAIG